MQTRDRHLIQLTRCEFIVLDEAKNVSRLKDFERVIDI